VQPTEYTNLIGATTKYTKLIGAAHNT